MYFSCRDDRSAGTFVPPGLFAIAACQGKPDRVLVAPAVRSSQAQVHVTNFDYNHHLLNTMPGTRVTRLADCRQFLLTSRARCG
jgi:hypothetical protein